jgi:hypothetical protein
MSQPTGHPYTDRSDYPPYKLRETLRWGVFLLPAMAVGWAVLKLAGYQEPGFTRRSKP